MDLVFWTLIWKRFACKAFREKKWRKEVTVPGAQVNKFFVIWSSHIATYQWQLCLHFTCAMSRTDHQKFMIACCFVNGVVDPLAIVFDSIWFCWRVVVQYGWELHTSQFHFILMPPLSHVYNHRRLTVARPWRLWYTRWLLLLGCWWWHDLQNIKDTTDVWYRLMLWRFFKWVLIYTGRKNWNIYRCNYEPRYNWQTCVRWSQLSQKNATLSFKMCGGFWMAWL